MQPLCIQLLFVKFSKIAQSCTLANLVNEIKCCSRITQAVVSLCLHHEYFCIAHEYPVVVALPGISGTPFIFIETSTCILGSIFEIVNFLSIAQWCSIVHQHLRAIGCFVLLTYHECLVTTVIPLFIGRPHTRLGTDTIAAPLIRAISRECQLLVVVVGHGSEIVAHSTLLMVVRYSKDYLGRSLVLNKEVGLIIRSQRVA